MLIPVVVLAALILAPASPAFAWMDEEPRSFSLPGEAKRLEQVQRRTLPKVEPEVLLAEDQERLKTLQGPQPLRFAVADGTAFTLKNSGTWQALPDGLLWRLRIHSPGAVSHNLGITRYDMPKGAKLWIYDPGHQHVEGPYMARHRSHHGDFWTPIIEGDEIVVEVFVPAGVSKPFLKFHVNQGYRGFRGFDKTIPGQGTAGTCNNDVVCPVGAPWAAIQIKSVGAYTVSGTAACSGTLLNNALQDGTPYFLSAHHCNVTSVTDSTVVVYWNYESPICGNQGPGSTADNQSGSTLRAKWATSDFMLLELASVPPAAYDVHYSGWDTTAIAPAATVGIHHPSVDIKSISFSNTPAQSAFYGSPFTNPSGDHWRVTWDSGVTEPGSSGSCLFDATTQRCIGQLHGGASACGNPPSALWDDYGKFGVSWTGGGTSATRLRDWLDPLNSGITAMDGDPHLTTADGIHYDFQGAGEYVALRHDDGMEIQARTLPISTTFNPGPDPYDGLATCVSLTTAVAANVDGHRVTIQPNLSGFPDPSGLQVRVDGVLTAVGPTGVAVGAGRIAKPGSSSYEINFPNGTALYVNALYWASQGKWYMNLDVFRSQGMSGLSRNDLGGGGGADLGGLLAPLAQGSWLPALPDGSSLGPMPGTLNQRYIDLYQKFGNAWRVGGGSLFDYAPGTSTATFTVPTWPPQNPPCTIPQAPVAKPLSLSTAQSLCEAVTDKTLKADCVFDVQATGEAGFADLFLATQRLRAGATVTTLIDRKNPTALKEPVELTAAVRLRGAGEGLPQGAVQFLVDGKPVGSPVPLDQNGHATWAAADLEPGDHRFTAQFIAKKGSVFLDSSSFEEPHTVDWK
ncbi:MAG TPA: Ig-like domain repeat protein [Thermoanaerobaculia bacterium]|nr:Ig-like domain repeat protein [Thermoanaerobaculia bacterium]